MDANTVEWMNAIFRWMHVVAGVLWIGLLYYFNWINGVFASKLDAETKQKVLPELLPRALYFFRWGAAYTWISGVLLLALVYYHGGTLMTEDDTARGMASLIGVGTFLVGAVIYDLMWKALQGNQPVGVVVSFVLVIGVMFGLTAMGLSGRAMYIHIGALFGTAMAMNVWMRIWPAQRKIIAAVKNGEKPDPAWGAIAGLRSKHNTYMSVPLIFIMISNHFPGMFGSDMGIWILAGVIAVGWLFTNWVYKKSKTDAPAFY
jgi:uncharacterized membrane protein